MAVGQGGALSSYRLSRRDVLAGIAGGGLAVVAATLTGCASTSKMSIRATTGSSSVLWLRYGATERTPALAAVDPTTGQVRISARNVSPSATRIGDSVIDSVLVVDEAMGATLRTTLWNGRAGSVRSTEIVVVPPGGSQTDGKVSMAVSSDGRYCAIYCESYARSSALPASKADLQPDRGVTGGLIVLFAVATGARLATYRLPDVPVDQGGDGGSLSWDINAHQLTLFILRGKSMSDVSSLALTFNVGTSGRRLTLQTTSRIVPLTTYLASSYSDPTVTLPGNSTIAAIRGLEVAWYDTVSGRLIKTIDVIPPVNHPEPVYQSLITPDTRYLVVISTSSRTRIDVFDLLTRARVAGREFHRTLSSASNPGAVLPGGRALLVVNPDVDEGALVVSLPELKTVQVLATTMPLASVGVADNVVGLLRADHKHMLIAPTHDLTRTTEIQLPSSFVSFM